MDTTTRVVASIYSRYSSDMQRESSIADQERNCRKRAEAEGWTIGEMFADKAITGSDSRRPQYLRMQQAAARAEFSVLLVDDLSRLTRDSRESETLIRKLEFQRIRIIGISDGYDSQSKSRKIHRQVKAMTNEIFLDDLRDKVHRGLSGQAIAQRWCGSRPYGYRLKALRDPSRLDAYGEASKIGTVLEVAPDKAAVVVEIFTRFADGQSCHSIAEELNARGIASPGSAWKRTVRRAQGWLSSGVRVIIKNPIYRGEYRWNTSQFVTDETPDMKRKRNPDRGKYIIRRARPKSEWIVSQVEAWRIVPDALWTRAQDRFKALKNDDKRLRNGGTPKYLLSGLLRCEVCGAHYVKANGRGYGCSSYWHGKACKNSIFVRRDALESIILGPAYDGLLAPQRIAKLVKEAEANFAKTLQERAARAVTLPRALQDLDDRLARLRARLQKGDPDMAADEIQVAIDRAESKRRELAATQPEVRQHAKLLALLPKAAAMYRKQIKEGLMGDVRSALKARVVLRHLIGEVTLYPKKDGSLWARWAMNPGALVRAANGVDTSGSGGRI